MKYLKSLGEIVIFQIIALLPVLLSYIIILILLTALNISDKILQNQFNMILGSLLSLFFLSKYFKGNLIKMCNFKKIKISHTLIIILASIFYIIISSFIIKALDLDKYFPQSVISYENRIQGVGAFFWSFAGVILAPIYEEILCRGIIFNHLKKTFPLFAAVIIQALIFSILHFNLLQCIVVFSTGIMFGLIYIKFKSILAPMIGHFAINCASSISYYIVNGYLDNYLILLLIFSIIGISLCVIYILKIKVNHETNEYRSL